MTEAEFAYIAIICVWGLAIAFVVGMGSLAYFELWKMWREKKRAAES